MIGEEDTRPRHLHFFWSSNPQEEDTETDADPQRSFRQSILRIWLKKRMLTSEAFLGYESIGIRHQIWRSSLNVLAVSGHIQKLCIYSFQEVLFCQKKSGYFCPDGIVGQ